jgi:hypothetical protein
LRHIPYFGLFLFNTKTESVFDIDSRNTYFFLLSNVFQPFIMDLSHQITMVCDFQELDFYLIENFIIHYCQGLAKSDFIFVTEKASGHKKGKENI